MLTAKEDRIKALLDQCSDVSLTTDIWTDRRTHAFLAITAHAFVYGKPLRMLLSFKAFPGSHTGDKISEAIMDVIDAYKLQSKIRCIVTYNASNMRKAVHVMLSVLDDNSPATSNDDNIGEQTDTVIDNPSL
jgi:hypothetical protein